MTKTEIQNQLQELAKLDLDECASGMVIERAMITIKRLAAQLEQVRELTSTADSLMIDRSMQGEPRSGELVRVYRTDSGKLYYKIDKEKLDAILNESEAGE